MQRVSGPLEDIVTMRVRPTVCAKLLTYSLLPRPQTMRQIARRATLELCERLAECRLKLVTRAAHSKRPKDVLYCLFGVFLGTVGL